MDFNAVYHRANDNYCYPLDEEQLVINIRTGYDVKYVNLIYGDPFSAGILGGGESWEGEAVNIPFKKRLKNQLWWTTTIKPAYKRLKYYFELQAENERWFYFEDGFVSEEQMALAGRSRQYFIFPWMNPADLPVTPAWVNDTIWYQIFPERFCNGDPSINPEGTLPWRVKGSVTNEEFFGGDLQGIINKLDYIRDLGVSGIYLTPINESPSSHKYDTTDYTKIDPHFGSEETMKTLVREAHNRGIRVMLDGVFNHSGENFAPWLDVKEKGPQSEYWDWFMVNEWPFGTEGNCAREKKYYTFAFYDNMPKLNTNNPKVRKYLIDVCENWVSNYDVDGIRLDVANEVSHTFCKELRSRLKAIKPDIYILGEIWHDAMPWLRGDEFDSVMNYDFRKHSRDFFALQKTGTDGFAWGMTDMFLRYPNQVSRGQLNLLDSHDVPRFYSLCGEDYERWQMAFLYLCMAPGVPSVFYGDERRISGIRENEYRSAMPWDCACMETRQFVKTVIGIRKKWIEPCAEWVVRVADARENLLVFERVGTKRVRVLMHRGSDKKDVEAFLADRKILMQERMEGRWLCRNGFAVSLFD